MKCGTPYTTDQVMVREFESVALHGRRRDVTFNSTYYYNNVPSTADLRVGMFVVHTSIPKRYNNSLKSTNATTATL